MFAKPLLSEAQSFTFCERITFFARQQTLRFKYRKRHILLQTVFILDDSSKNHRRVNVSSITSF
jgi:hypothetical protein